MKEKINKDIQKPLADNSSYIVDSFSTIPSNGVHIQSFKDRKIEQLIQSLRDGSLIPAFYCQNEQVITTINIRESSD